MIDFFAETTLWTLSSTVGRNARKYDLLFVQLFVKAIGLGLDIYFILH